MADIGGSLISKIVADGDIVPATTSGIRAAWFEDAEHREVYAWMLEYFSRYGEAPTASALKSQFPNYRLLKVGEPYQYYIDRFRDQQRRAILVDSVVDAHEALENDDPKKAEDSLSRGLNKLGREVSVLVDEDVIETRSKRFVAYDLSRENVGKLTGVSTGFSMLDLVTGGFHPEQFIVLGGQAKQCKSFMLMKGGQAAQEQGNKVLFLSFEMSVFEQTVRYDAMCCHINANHLMRGNLTNGEMQRLKKGLQKRKGLPPFIISTDISATTTVSGLAGKIEQHKPDIVFIDGAYLMDNEIGAEQGSTQAYTSISRGLKRLAQRIKKPVIVTTQSLPGKMRGGEVTMHSLGWTSAWAQDADLILGVERQEDANMLRMRIVGGRNVSPCEFAIRCDWDRAVFAEIDPDDKYDD